MIRLKCLLLNTKSEYEKAVYYVIVIIQHSGKAKTIVRESKKIIGC